MKTERRNRIPGLVGVLGSFCRRIVTTNKYDHYYLSLRGRRLRSGNYRTISLHTSFNIKQLEIAPPSRDCKLRLHQPADPRNDIGGMFFRNVNLNSNYSAYLTEQG